MFICAVTKKSSLAGEKPTKLIVETRPRIYEFHEDGPCKDSTHRCCAFAEVIRSTRGSEIVKEIMVSAAGMELLEKIALEQEAYKLGDAE